MTIEMIMKNDLVKYLETQEESNRARNKTAKG